MPTMEKQRNTSNSESNRTQPTNSNAPKLPRLPGYQFIQNIGQGAQGKLYLAKREFDNSLVAIKQLNIESIKNWKEYELFDREAKVLASLNITGVCKFYETIERLEDNPPCSYIVQEYIDGPSLSKLINAGHRFSMNQVYGMIIQIIEILQQLHTHQPPVIHRDVKPSNILLKKTYDGHIQIYLIDFGAVANPQVQSGGSTVAGTFGYMPPEQLMGNPVPASDIYALGALAVQLFTGISPSDLPQKDFHLIFEPQMQSYPVELVNTLRSMLEPDPNKRLKDHKELLRLFNAFKNSIYESGGSRQNALPLDIFDKKLQKVQSYGDPGNLELWQELSDNLPRPEESLPPAYLNLTERVLDSNEYHFYSKPYFDKTSFSVEEETELESIGCILETIVILLTVAGFGGICYLFYLMLTSWHFSGLKSFFIFFFSSCVYFVVIALLWDRIKGVFHIKMKKIKRKELSYQQSFSQLSIKNLLKNGRKTIATIVGIQYIEATDKYVERNLKNATNDAPMRLTDKEIYFCYHASPQFRIDYKFNPPDDEKEEELVHRIYTHIDPENHYKVGDPLPILYEIYRDYTNTETVRSMPFPLPISDVFSDDNVYYTSS